MGSWKAGTAVALAGVALGLGGCVEFEGPIKGKQISEEKVKIGFRICDDRTSECNPAPMEMRGPAADETRVLIAVRAPKGTDMPNNFTPKGVDVVFSGSGSYGSELNDKAPRKDEEKWYGYRSEPINEVAETEARFRLKLGLPRDAGKTFKFRPVVGYQDGPPRDSVTCAEDPREPFNDGDTEIVCIDDPTKGRQLRKSIEIKLD